MKHKKNKTKEETKKSNKITTKLLEGGNSNFLFFSQKQKLKNLKNVLHCRKKYAAN